MRNYPHNPFRKYIAVPLGERCTMAQCLGQSGEREP